MHYTMPGSIILPHHGHTPQLDEGVFVAAGGCVIGETQIGADSSIWFHAVVRGDVNWIRIGARSNVQDNAVVHVTHQQAATTIGDEVTIGHSAIVHGCTIEERCLIGMGAVIMDGAVIGAESMVAAGSLVPPGKTYPPRSLILGSPAKAARSLTEAELAHLAASAQHYVLTAQSYMSGTSAPPGGYV